MVTPGRAHLSPVENPRSSMKTTFAKALLCAGHRADHTSGITLFTPPNRAWLSLQNSWAQKDQSALPQPYCTEKQLHMVNQILKAYMHFEIKIVSFQRYYCKIQNSFIKAVLSTFLFLPCQYLKHIPSLPVLMNLELLTITQQGRCHCTHFTDKTTKAWRNHTAVTPVVLDSKTSR